MMEEFKMKDVVRLSQKAIAAHENIRWINLLWSSEYKDAAELFGRISSVSQQTASEMWDEFRSKAKKLFTEKIECYESEIREAVAITTPERHEGD
jgi:hypothetical protein